MYIVILVMRQPERVARLVVVVREFAEEPELELRLIWHVVACRTL